MLVSEAQGGPRPCDPAGVLGGTIPGVVRTVPRVEWSTFFATRTFHFWLMNFRMYGIVVHRFHNHNIKKDPSHVILIIGRLKATLTSKRNQPSGAEML